MGKQHRPGKFRQPSSRETARIWHIGIPLSDLFDEHDLGKFMDAAKRRIVAEFIYAMEVNPRFKPGSDRRPMRRTDNYIIGLGGKQSALADYVLKTMHRPFIRPRQLPSRFSDLHPIHVERIVFQAQYDVLLLVVQTMYNYEIWYDEGIGIWQVNQKSVDELNRYRRAAKEALAASENQSTKEPRSHHRVKADMRPFHGRVRSQSKNRGIPGGTSIGLA